MTSIPADPAIEARALRDAGLAQAQAHAPKFADLAYAAIERVARRQVHVHIDDVLTAIATSGLPVPNHPNVWGAVWARAIRAKLIQRTNQVKPCTADPKKHAHQYPVYFSLIYDPRSAP
jgi:hypothetical protein